VSDDATLDAAMAAVDEQEKQLREAAQAADAEPAPAGDAKPTDKGEVDTQTASPGTGDAAAVEPEAEVTKLRAQLEDLTKKLRDSDGQRGQRMAELQRERDRLQAEKDALFEVVKTRPTAEPEKSKPPKVLVTVDDIKAAYTEAGLDPEQFDEPTLKALTASANLAALRAQPAAPAQSAAQPGDSNPVAELNQRIFSMEVERLAPGATSAMDDPRFKAMGGMRINPDDPYSETWEDRYNRTGKPDVIAACVKEFQKSLNPGGSGANAADAASAAGSGSAPTGLAAMAGPAGTSTTVKPDGVKQTLRRADYDRLLERVTELDHVQTTDEKKQLKAYEAALLDGRLK